MPHIVMLMLAVQVAILIVLFATVAIRRPTPERPGILWSSLTISLFVIGNVSLQISRDHQGDPGADILQFGGAMLFGMSILCAMMLFRERRLKHSDRADPLANGARDTNPV